MNNWIIKMWASLTFAYAYGKCFHRNSVFDNIIWHFSKRFKVYLHKTRNSIHPTELDSQKCTILGKFRRTLLNQIKMITNLLPNVSKSVDATAVAKYLGEPTQPKNYGKETPSSSHLLWWNLTFSKNCIFTWQQSTIHSSEQFVTKHIKAKAQSIHHALARTYSMLEYKIKAYFITK